jgi:hypothetical protein
MLRTLAPPFVVALCCAVPLLAQTPGFTSFDAPHAGTLFNTGTFAVKINVSGMIAGYYIDESGWKSHGFYSQARRHVY